MPHMLQQLQYAPPIADVARKQDAPSIAALTVDVATATVCPTYSSPSHSIC
jgi:hypothetical protein